MRKAIGGVIVLVGIVAIALCARSGLFLRAGQEVFLTAEVSRGPVALEVTSTGTLNSVVTVQVGTQVSGTIQELPVDYNTKVKAGQVIAKLDPALFKAAVDRERANIAAAEADVLKQRAVLAQVKRALDSAEDLYNAELAQARANLAVSRAKAEEAKATLVQAKRALDRANVLVRQKTISDSEKDKAQADHETAEALLKAAEAQAEAAQASLQLTQVQSKNARDNAQTEHESAVALLKAEEARLEQAKAAHELARVNYERTIITSPIDGIVVARQVDVGQTVAASLQSPTLFTIANDLAKMQVEATVDEADIGKIHARQRVTFTVDAFPNDTFVGTVSQVRLAHTTVQNVVTYTVIVAVDNTESRLMPGMTANATFHIEERESVLRVPNSALRFHPPDHAIEPSSSAAPQEKEKEKGEEWMRVWVEGDNHLLRPIAFRPGLSDMRYTEILEGNLAEGRELIIGTTESQAPAPTGPLSGVRRF